LKNDFIMPILALALICLFMSGALAAVNDVTRPIINKAADERADKARREIMPDAAEFVLVDTAAVGELPARITGIYKTTNNIGYIFMISSNGYGGEVSIVCGIDNDGNIIETTVLSHTETKGISDAVFDRVAIFAGKDKSLVEGIDAVSGATISSNAVKNGIIDAFAAFEKIKEAGL